MTLLPYVILALTALLAGVLARKTSLGFWGGFFMQMFITVIFFPILGQIAIFPGVVVVFLLNRYDRNSYRRLQQRVCPFSQEVRDECVAYYDEESIRRKSGAARPQVSSAPETGKTPE